MGSNTRHHQWKMLRDTSKQKESKFRVYSGLFIVMYFLYIIFPCSYSSLSYQYQPPLKDIEVCLYYSFVIANIITQVYFLDTIIKVSFSKIYISFFA